MFVAQACDFKPYRHKMFDIPNFIGADLMLTSEVPPTEAELTGSFANRIFIELHQTIIVQEREALGGEVEAIHAMRVAIRRLRVAVSNFAVCLPREERRSLHTSLKQLADTLGRVRSLDLMIESLRLERKIRPLEDQAAINSFVRRLQARRRRQHRLLIKYLHGEVYANLKRRFSSPGNIGARVTSPEAEARPVQVKKQKHHGQAA
jgi:CHAD domain-containing protein